MKKYIFLLYLIMTVTTYGQTIENIRPYDFTMQLTDDEVVVGFRADIPGNILTNDQSLYLLPVITNGTHKVSMKPVVIRSNKAKIVFGRKHRAAGINPDSIQAYKEGQEIIYSYRFARQSWMQEADIILENLVTGCCNITKGNPLLIGRSTIAHNESRKTEIAETHMVTTVVPADTVIKQTTGSEIAKTFSFVLPSSQFNKDSLMVYDEDRENSITVYYKINENVIRPEYLGNQQTLINLEAAISVIKQSKDSKIAYVVIAGFASPEGPFEFNDKLAFERAVSVKDFIMQKTKLPTDIILLYNGSADWRGLKLLIEKSNLEWKNDVLHIINTVPIWNPKNNKGRMSEIMKLRNGEIYNYMKENLFPKLRNGAFIRVYYDDLIN